MFSCFGVQTAYNTKTSCNQTYKPTGLFHQPQWCWSPWKAVPTCWVFGTEWVQVLIQHQWELNSQLLVHKTGALTTGLCRPGGTSRSQLHVYVKCLIQGLVSAVCLGHWVNKKEKLHGKWKCHGSSSSSHFVLVLIPIHAGIYHDHGIGQLCGWHYII